MEKAKVKDQEKNKKSAGAEAFSEKTLESDAKQLHKDTVLVEKGLNLPDANGLNQHHKDNVLKHAYRYNDAIKRCP